ncbi:cell wall hydrolase [Neobacillus rhizophilus]|uniref:Cell wall hydrolase n=1 Tax=Neobacillus rhizophilus TaxID=2833579 RepID=A0A942YVZ2_9BACI|nr:cell wall hydrolase [Neobacillus rhizophilus]MBS4214437.1 cell wall hydrolase [Neobacillus rhizophilus]MBU8918326.1 cell wall hydrolase [Bacillus sp. FJAT-29953]
MIKLIATLTIVVSLLFASPVFAYTVKTGDTMTKIAREHNMTLQDLANRNPQVQNLDLIYVGQTIHTNDSEAEMTVARTVAVRAAAASAALKLEENQGYSEQELDLLARLVRAEAEIEPYEGKVAVACVVLNRVTSSAFPNSIREVIYQKGQFQPVRNGAINKPADVDSIKAVREALNEKRKLVGDSLFFYNPAISTSRWLDTRTTTASIGDHVFKR